MKKTSIAYIRREYLNEDLEEKKASKNPLALFQRWFKEARKAEVVDVNALALATVSKSGIPSNRIVLLKGLDNRGFVFFTNYQSQKGREISKRAVASLLFVLAAIDSSGSGGRKSGQNIREGIGRLF
jgi:pyridoxine/pyridoxamine 5'-phosphate oxidase